MKEFRDLILKGSFDEAYKLFQNMKLKDVCDTLISISFDTKNMLAYGFIMYSLMRNETIELHSIASSILMNSYVDIEGAGILAYNHVKRAIEIDSNSFLALSDMMFLSGHPDTNGTKEDFEWAKNRIRELYPNDSILKLEYGRGMPLKDLKNSKLAELNKN